MERLGRATWPVKPSGNGRAQREAAEIQNAGRFAPRRPPWLAVVPRPRDVGGCPLSSVFCLLSSVFCLLSSVFCLLSSVFCLLSSVFCLLSSVFCLLSSVFRPP